MWHSLTEWLPGWILKGWRTSSGSVANKEDRGRLNGSAHAVGGSPRRGDVPVDSGALLRDRLHPAQRAGQPPVQVDEGVSEGRAPRGWLAGLGRGGGGEDAAEFQPAGGQLGDRVGML